MKGVWFYRGRGRRSNWPQLGGQLLWVVRAHGVNTNKWPVGSWSYGHGLSSGQGLLLWVGQACGVNTDKWPGSSWSYGRVGVGCTGEAWWLVGRSVGGSVGW